ncbi:subtilisin-like protease [Olea europaea subsp. europaea]|uniref:Subtilisin-like protease n=1 Tax=Olea europaea subsp. europaea TaxID=158383 RepID=A0A8S0QW03_OLEEU|nr:subtilisin-like protease [Olea europaea subsp. europaea]
MGLIEAFTVLFSWFLLASAERSTYIVHMDKSLTPKAFSSHHYCAVMSKDELGALKKSPGFLSAYPDKIVTPDTTHTYKFLSLNTATGIWPASEYGKDVIIGIIDSGVWPESPSFKDDGMTEIPARWKGICQAGEGFNSSLCNKKLIGARYFSKGVREANPGDTITMDSARDDSGHGTHVASTAAGNYVDGVSFFGYAPGTARGVAPRARLAAYKVIWRQGNLESDFLAGIDQAVADGVDILSISLSNGRTNLHEDPIAIAAFGATEKGILVSTSAGNRGPNFATLIKGIPWAVVVASGTVDRWFAGTITLGNGLSITGWSLFPARTTVRNLALTYNETLSACNSTELLSEAPEGGIIICNQSDVTTDFYFLWQDLLNSNIRAAIIINEVTSIHQSASFPYPGVVITPRDVKDVVNYASKSADPRASIEFQQTILGTKLIAAPALAESSSRGPARSYPGILKPDIMAPGVLILAAYDPYANAARINNNIFLASDYALLSGTSMACPHISGIAAHPDWSPAAIRSAMMTTANPLDNTQKPIKDTGNNNNDAPPLEMGEGKLIQIVLLIQKFRRTVTNVGDGAVTYKVKVQKTGDSTITVFPETLVFRKKYDKQSYSVTIRYKTQGPFDYGSITWIEENGKHTVRSPFTVTLKPYD